MGYSERLDAMIVRAVEGWGTTRRKMFGGTCHLLNGSMMCGVHRTFLILRLGEEQAAEALRRPGVRPFDITGRPMKGWVMVEEAGLTEEALNGWIGKARAFVETLEVGR